MRGALVRTAGAALAAVLLAGPARAQERLDWEVEEEPAGMPIRPLRNLRDGLLGVLDDAADLQLAVFADAALLGALLVQGSSDLLGLIDDNPASQHVFKGVLSKSLARSAWLLHLAGSEAVLGSHGLERERYLEQTLVELNPLLDPQQDAPRLPLDPLCFVGEALIHREVYSAQIPGRITLAALAADGVLRPLGSAQRMLSLVELADALESRGTGLVRAAVK
jgi:hypothetical protein